jgi:hypothetical protein
MDSAHSPQTHPADPTPDSRQAPSPLDPAHAVEPSGYRGDNPATAGPGPAKVDSNTPENESGHLNPSAPEDSNTTPGSTSDK